MSLTSGVIAYLSEIQSEALERIYETAPYLKPKEGFPDWNGWQKIIIKPTDVIGAFTTIENWNSPEIEKDLGSLAEAGKDTEKATLLWLDAEIIALAEYVKSATSLKEMYSFSDSLARRLQILEYIDLKEVKNNLIQDYLAMRGKKGAQTRHEESNFIRSLAWKMYRQTYISSHELLSAKALFELTEAEYFTAKGSKIPLELKTFENWLSNFKHRIKSGE